MVLSGGSDTFSSRACFSSVFGGSAVCSTGLGLASRKVSDASPATAASATMPPTAPAIFRFVVLNQPSFALPKVNTPASAAAIPPAESALAVLLPGGLDRFSGDYGRGKRLPAIRGRI